MQCGARLGHARMQLDGHDLARRAAFGRQRCLDLFEFLQLVRLPVFEQRADLILPAHRRPEKAEMHRLAGLFENAVGNIASAVTMASSGLEAAASTLTKNAETTQRLSSMVAKASDEASVNVQSVASATSQLTGAVSDIRTIRLMPRPSK